MTVELISVYQANGDVKNGKDPDVILTLWNLLCERGDDVNISHKEVPSMRDHCDFVANRPYRDWYLIRNADNQIVGACYISKQGEIGIQIFKAYWRRGFASAALRQLMERSWRGGDRLLANINPRNAASVGLFKKFGFELLQHTYAKEF
jgi:RimJ/RimL family protein N-acetyltransferase